MRTAMGRGRRRAGAVTAAALLVGLLAAPAGAQQPDGAVDLLLGSGSDTTYEVMTDLDNLYNTSPGCATEAAPGEDAVLNFTCAAEAEVTTENVDHDLALQAFPLGSSNGIRQLCGRGRANVANVDYARSSRAPRSSDCQGLRFVAFARDAISWVSFPDAPDADSAGVTDLDINQLIGIFGTCSIVDWRQLKDPAFVLPAGYDPAAADSQPIYVYTAQEGSGTRGTWDDFLGDVDSSACIPDDRKDGGPDDRVIFENNAQPIIDNGEQGNAIFFYSFGPYQTADPQGEGSTIGAVEGIEPSAETVGDGTFPFGRFLYNVYRADLPADNATDDARRYVGEDAGWICKGDDEHAEGVGEAVAATITGGGFVPLPIGPIGGGVTGESKCRVTPIPAA